MKKIFALVIVSCDAYVDIVKHYLALLEKNWPEFDYPIVVATETIALDNPNVSSITSGKNTTWTKRLIDAINYCGSRYILLTIEDLFISEKVDNSLILEALSFIKKEKILYYRIPVFKVSKKRERYPGNENVELIRRNERYNVSIGTAIWDTQELLEIIGDGSMSAWDLENYFLNQAESSSPGFLDGYVSDTRFLLHSVHMIKSGKWIPKSVKTMNKLGYRIDTKHRGFIGLADRIKLNSFYSWCSRKFPTRLRRAIKKVFSFFGFKFASK